MAKSDAPGRKRGRKKQPERPAGTNKEHTLGVRLTQADFEQLKAEADSCNMFMSEYLRAVWRGTPLAPVTPRLPARLMNEWEQQAYYAWVGVGNGLQQFLKRRLGEQVVRGQAEAMLDEIKEALAQFRAFVAREEIEENYDDLYKEFTHDRLNDRQN